MATHSSVLAWGIPGTGEAGGLSSGVTQSWTRLKRLSSSRYVIVFLLRSNHLLISWLQSPSAVILEPKKIKSASVSTFYPIAMGLDVMIFIF